MKNESNFKLSWPFFKYTLKKNEIVRTIETFVWIVKILVCKITYYLVINILFVIIIILAISIFKVLIFIIIIKTSFINIFLSVILVYKHRYLFPPDLNFQCARFFQFISQSDLVDIAVLYFFYNFHWLFCSFSTILSIRKKCHATQERTLYREVYLDR